MIGWLLCLGAAAAPVDSVYLIMVDRFENGDESNDQGVDKDTPTAWHGGDLKGILNRVGFLEDLGVSTIWLTPITRSRTEPIGEHPSWHGYWVADGRAVDERFGTLEDLKTLNAELTGRGMGLMLDMVLNHVGPDTPLTHAHPEWFHGLGDVTDWTNDIQRRTHDVHGLPDLDQSQDAVAKHLVQDGTHWVREVAPSAIRIDAVRHLDPTFLKGWIQTLQATAEAPLVFAGEVFDGNPAAIAAEARQTGFTHSFDFPLYYAIIEGLCEQGDLRKIAAALTQDRQYPKGHQWITFLDNHDTQRVATVCGERTQAAVSLMMSLRGIPAITWGTGQGMTGGKEIEARGDMVFEKTPFHGFIAERLNERRSFSALTEGMTDWLVTQPAELGFARVTADQAIVVSVGGNGKPPSLPAEAGNPTWLSLPDTGIHRWLLTPELGQDFSAWVKQLSAEQTLFRSITLTTGSESNISGSDPAVGAWNPENAVGPGTATVLLPAGGVVALKSVKQTEDGRPIWSAHPDLFVVVDEIGDGGTVKVGP